MSSRFGPSVRRNALLVFTALVVSCVRTFLQYHYYYKSLEQFLISWFIHYIAIAIVYGVSFAVVKETERYFLSFESEKKHESTASDRMIFYVSITLLVAAVFILLIAHWTPSYISDEGW